LYLLYHYIRYLIRIGIETARNDAGIGKEACCLYYWESSCSRRNIHLESADESLPVMFPREVIHDADNGIHILRYDEDKP